MLELYHAAISTCSQRVRQALHEKGLEWVDRHLMLNNNEHLSPEYLKLNPNGLVPTLVHDGKAIPDSSVIMEYLEDVFPAKPLRPGDPYEVSRLRAWVQYIDEVPTAAARYPSFHMVFGKRLRSLSREQMSAVAAPRPLRKHFFLQMGPSGFSQELLDAAMEQLTQSFDRMEQGLVEGPWLLGKMFSLVDISALPTVVRMEDLGLNHFYEDRPRVAAWYKRIKERPSFAAAYYPESRVKIGP
jgi:glutathione S-transferase